MNKYKKLTVQDSIEYQQRLERVLAKFEHAIEGFKFKSLVYYNNEFIDLFWGKLSLETVESLLKDLGVLK